MRRIQVPVSKEASDAIRIDLGEIADQIGRNPHLLRVVSEEFEEQKNKRGSRTAADVVHERDADVRNAIKALHKALTLRACAERLVD